MPVRFLCPAHYQSYGQYNGSPNQDQLSRYFYLNDFDLAQIRHRRRKSNRMGFALQLVTVRFLETYLHHQASINDVYGYRSFYDVLPSYQFLRWLYTRVRIGSKRPSLLLENTVKAFVCHVNETATHCQPHLHQVVQL